MGSAVARAHLCFQIAIADRWQNEYLLTLRAAAPGAEVDMLRIRIGYQDGPQVVPGECGCPFFDDALPHSADRKHQRKSG